MKMIHCPSGALARGGEIPVKRTLCLFLTILIVLSCTGCRLWDGSYVSISPHRVGYDQPGQEAGVVSSYSELRTAVLGMVDTGQTEAVLTLSDYPQPDAGEDMAQLAVYARDQYPIGAWAVSEIRYEFGQNLLSLEIDYRRSKTDIDRIRSVRGLSGAKEAISAALQNYQDSLVLQISGYYDTDLIQYIADYAAEHPDLVMELPQVSAQVYPQSGTVRILELQFTYQTSRESLRSMSGQVRQVFSSARLYVASDASDSTRISQLCSFLMERFDYTLQTSITPSYSLLCHGVGDSRAFAQVYAAMLRQSGLEAMTVSGTYQGESRFWNIVRDGERYYHVDLLECARLGGCQLRTDGEMTDYVWDYSAYPVCGPQE